MAAKTRPYKIVWKGETRMVEATSAAQAAAYVVGIEISELRAATPTEVVAWMRAGNEVPVAGDDLARAPTPTKPDPARTEFDADDAEHWLREKLGTIDSLPKQVAEEAFVDARATGFLTLEQFTKISVAVPAFGEMVEKAELQNDETIAFQDVVTAIELARKNENLEAQAERA
jgi:hypothetical protein